MGRVGVLIDSAPEIYPVNFVVDNHAIVFRTDPGSKLSGLERSPSVSFEVDSIDVENNVGWSVLIKGRATEVADAEHLAGVQALPLRFWDIGLKGHWIRIDAQVITGRRIHPR